MPPKKPIRSCGIEVELTEEEIAFHSKIATSYGYSDLEDYLRGLMLERLVIMRGEA